MHDDLDPSCDSSATAVNSASVAKSIQRMCLRRENAFKGPF